MCGFFGALDRLPEDACQRVSRALAHRGPDAEGRFQSDAVTLLHRRLKIIDLSEGGAQPMSGAGGAVQVVFNGEIYNHRELERELEGLGHTFRSRSDTEAIVRGYEAWGEGVVARLDGMFALAIWDARAQTLLLARDRPGKKPLFYGEANGVFRFGSSIAALQAAGHPAEPAPEVLPYYLSFGFVPAPLTFHRGVNELPPASLLRVVHGRPDAPTRYWRPRFGVTSVEDDYATATARVRELVTAAVGRRLESDVPLGAFLSGGVDSTIVVGLMAALGKGRVRTFSIGFTGDPRYDETSFAKLAAQRFGTEHTVFQVSPSSLELVETLVRHHDGPFGDSSAIPAYVVAKLTREHVTVALTGDGGDELFCGYSRFLAAELTERAPQGLRRLLGRVPRLPTSSERTTLGRVSRLLDHIDQALPDRLAGWMPFFSQADTLIRPEVRAALPTVEPPMTWQHRMAPELAEQSLLGRILQHNFETYLPFDLLVKSDRTSMAHGLETRAPFLDKAVIEYVSRLPAGYLRRGARTKVILREAFRDLLPEPIHRRGKMGFGVPLGTWFRADLRGYLTDHLGPGAHLEEYLDRQAVDQVLREHLAERADHGQRLWALLTLEIWLRSLAGRQGVIPERRCGMSPLTQHGD
jgi:asparagine synthase (glutamine-hydrolysing)